MNIYLSAEEQFNNRGGFTFLNPSDPVNQLTLLFQMSNHKYLKYLSYIVLQTFK